jgi:pantoate--beta-alanine ligase
MQVIQYKKELAEIIGNFRTKGKSIGLVPTMGALHDGHLSLIRNCKKENGCTVSSIFVNPTQFNDKNDLKNYPRNLDKDIQLLNNENCDLVFCPEVNEMYPEPDDRIFDFNGLDILMEGKHRPGHFNGVAQIVTKLFDAVKPDSAYFGEKDFQQLAIIKHLVASLNLPIKIVPCPIIREDDGLAKSSRNLLLGINERKSAPLIFRTLKSAGELHLTLPIKEIVNRVIAEINSNPFLSVEYFEIVDDKKLLPIYSWNIENGIVGCIAVKAGKIRLIDNIRFK